MSDIYSSWATVILLKFRWNKLTQSYNDDNNDDDYDEDCDDEGSEDDLEINICMHWHVYQMHPTK